MKLDADANTLKLETTESQSSNQIPVNDISKNSPTTKDINSTNLTGTTTTETII